MLSWHRTVITNFSTAGVALTKLVLDHWIIGRTSSPKLIALNQVANIDEEEGHSKYDEENANNNEKLHDVKVCQTLTLIGI